MDERYEMYTKNGTEVLTFHRCIYKHIVVHSVLYERAVKSNDTVFLLNSGDFVQVINILYFDEAAYAEVRYLKAEKVHLPCENEHFISD